MPLPNLLSFMKAYQLRKAHLRKIILYEFNEDMSANLVSHMPMEVY